MTLRAQQMKSVTNMMENVFAQAHTMETNANLVSIQFQALFKNIDLQNTIQNTKSCLNLNSYDASQINKMYFL